MHKERLTRLADFLDGLGPDQFSIYSWVHNPGEGEKPGGCGTVACAAGWACTLPDFNAVGFDFPVFGYKPTYRTPSKLYSGDEALCKFFGLTLEQSGDIFYPGAYVRPDFGRIEPRHVAARIRGLLKQEGA
jgi:hypothetical protein